jgi:hypothetical protein
MKPPSVLTICFAVLCFAGCGGAAQRDVEPAGGARTGLSFYEVRNGAFSLGIPKGWSALTLDQALGDELDKTVRAHPELEETRQLLSSADSPFKLFAVKEERSGVSSTLNVVKVQFAVGWNVHDFEAGVVDGVRGKAADGKVRVDRMSFPAGSTLKLRMRSKAVTADGRIVPVDLVEYVIRRDGTAYILAYATAPPLAERYAPLFERSARSLRPLG